MSRSDHNGASSLGGTVGGRIARLTADAVVASKQRMSGHTAGVAQKILADFTNHVSDEMRALVGPLWAQLANDPATSPEMRPLFRALAYQRGQAMAWLGGTAVGAAMGGGLLNLLTNTLNPVILPIIASAPHGILTPDQAAAAEVRRLGRGFEPRYDANSGGIDNDRYDALLAMQTALPTVEQTLDILNRGHISSEIARDIFRLYGYREQDIDTLLLSRVAILSPEILAAMWNRDIVTLAEGRTEAARSGMNATNFDRLTLLGGDPPAPQELLLAWRRGIIDESDVNRALVQGPLRKEWIEVIKSLQWQPLPLGEAADAVNQNHMSLSDAQRVARENGVRTEDFDIFVANAGLPPGPQETLDWVNRGLLTEQEGLQALYESRIKNKWVPLYMQSRHETMPPETIRLMYTRGAIPAADAIRRLMMRGYSAEDSAVILDGASAEKTQATRDLTQAQIRDLYADRAITREDALSTLEAMGFEASEADWILQLADLARVRRFMTAAINRIRASYLAGRIDENGAIGRLDELGMPVEQRDDAMILWQVERSTVSRGLTPAQIVSAVKKGFLTVAAGLSRLTGQGYAEDDAVILLKIAGAVE